MRLLLVFLFLFNVLYAAKIAIFFVEIANSQVIWNQRVAETLLRDNHNVTLIKIHAFKKDRPTIHIDPRVRIHRVNADVGLDVEAVERKQAETIYEETSFFDAREQEMLAIKKRLMIDSCELVLQNREFLSWLENEKFDLAFSHVYDFCQIGLIHNAKIPSWIWLNSGALMDYAADAIGVPLVPSYVPPMMMESGAKMNFYSRIKSVIGSGLTKIMYPRMVPNPQTALFRKHISPDFPDLLELAGRAPLVMVNSNELYESPRPTLHKVVYIGGLGMQFKDAKPLTPEFQKIVDSSKKGVILMSFGSAAKADLMPQHWKEAFLKAFARFPDYQFVVRYEARDLDSVIPSNVHLSKWIPQNDLLKNEKTVGFISHGGYNSIQETLASGKPIITIPLFGDQPRNAMFAAETGFGINLRKATLSAETIEEAIRTMIDDKSYSAVSKRISDMVRKKPIKPDELLLKWTAFLAEFKTLDNLIPYGTKLSFIQYHSLDVIAFLATILVALSCTIFLIIRKIFRKFLVRKILKRILSFSVQRIWKKLSSIFGGKTKKE